MGVFFSESSNSRTLWSFSVIGMLNWEEFTSQLTLDDACTTVNSWEFTADSGGHSELPAVECSRICKVKKTPGIIDHKCLKFTLQSDPNKLFGPPCIFIKLSQHTYIALNQLTLNDKEDSQLLGNSGV